MAKKPHSDAGAHSEAPKEEAAKSADPRTRIVDAMMTLAATRRFEDIAIRDFPRRPGSPSPIIATRSRPRARCWRRLRAASTARC